MVDINMMVQELTRDEGEVPYAYQDSRGYWTIGVGRLIDRRLHGGLSEQEIAFLLQNDIEVALQDIQSEPWFLACQTDDAKRGLLNMRFQLGSDNLRTFKTSLGLIAQGRFAEAGVNLRKSNWYKETPDRAERTIKQIECG